MLRNSPTGYPPNKPTPWNTATFAAILVMILTTPMIFNHGSEFLYPWVTKEWGMELGQIAFWGAWAVILATLFTMLRTSLNSSIGLAGMWFVERLIF